MIEKLLKAALVLMIVAMGVGRILISYGGNHHDMELIRYGTTINLSLIIPVLLFSALVVDFEPVAISASNKELEER
jgi:hypothetical protein